MATVLKKVAGWPFTFGGELHSGWLPAEAAPPQPRLMHRELLDITIEQEDGGGYLLIHVARPSPTCPDPFRPPCGGDSWHDSLEDAEEAAHDYFGIRREDWSDVAPNA